MDLQSKNICMSEAETVIAVLRRWALSGSDCNELLANGLAFLEGLLQEIHAKGSVD